MIYAYHIVHIFLFISIYTTCVWLSTHCAMNKLWHTHTHTLAQPVNKAPWPWHVGQTRKHHCSFAGQSKYAMQNQGRLRVPTSWSSQCFSWCTFGYGYGVPPKAGDLSGISWRLGWLDQFGICHFLQSRSLQFHDGSFHQLVAGCHALSLGKGCTFNTLCMTVSHPQNPKTRRNLGQIWRPGHPNYNGVPCDQPPGEILR